MEANLALTRRAYELWNEGGVEAMVEHLIAPDIVFHPSPEFPDASVFRGAEAVAARLRELIELLGDFQTKVRSLEGRGDWVLAAFEVSVVGAASGAPVTTPVFHLLRYGGSRVREIWIYLDADQARREYERLAGSRSG